MPIYTCECCKFNTLIKTQYSAHLLTSKHIKLSVATPVVEVEKDEIMTAIDFLFKEIQELKLALQEMKQGQTPQKTQEPQHIIIQQGCPLELVKVADETCNPRYIEKQLNDDSDNSDIPDIQTYFSFKQNHVKFDFDDVEDFENLTEIGKGYVVDKITDFVKSNIKKNVLMPFKYIKSGWFIKTKEGWEKSEVANNKGKMPCDDGYNHNIILELFIYIFQNRLVTFLNSIDSRWMTKFNVESTRLTLNVFGKANYKNTDILSPLKELF
jgi:hypothetical protein